MINTQLYNTYFMFYRYNPETFLDANHIIFTYYTTLPVRIATCRSSNERNLSSMPLFTHRIFLIFPAAVKFALLLEMYDLRKAQSAPQ